MGLDRPSMALEESGRRKGIGWRGWQVTGTPVAPHSSASLTQAGIVDPLYLIPFSSPRWSIHSFIRPSPSWTDGSSLDGDPSCHLLTSIIDFFQQLWARAAISAAQAFVFAIRGRRSWYFSSSSSWFPFPQHKQTNQSNSQSLIIWRATVNMKWSAIGSTLSYAMFSELIYHSAARGGRDLSSLCEVRAKLNKMRFKEWSSWSIDPSIHCSIHPSIHLHRILHERWWRHENCRNGHLMRANDR